MRLPRDERFREEASRFDLRYECEDCVLFDSLRGCAHGYPNAEHLRSARASDDLVFCQDFDLA